MLPAHRPSRRPLLTVALALIDPATLALAGCGAPDDEADRAGPGDPVAGARPDVQADPARRFEALEARLLDAPELHITFTVTSEGAFPASLTGTLDLGRDSTVALRADGSFGDAVVDLHLRSDGRVTEGGSGDATFSGPTPPALREALVVGLTRMGILHNLALLTAAAPPDRAGGGVAEWVQVHEVHDPRRPATDPATTGADRPAANRAPAERPGLDGLAFTLHVAGARAGEAVLWLDPATGLPVERHQTVVFPSGRMAVVERYEFR